MEEEKMEEENNPIEVSTASADDQPEESAPEESAQEESAPEESEQEEMIPKSRFNQVYKQKKELKAALDAREAENEKLQETVDSLNNRIRELESSFKAREESWQIERALMQAGLLDEEGREIARFLYSRLKVADGEEKPSISAWIASLKEDGAEIPPALAPYLSRASNGASKGLPKSNAHTKQASPTQSGFKNVGQMSVEDYRQHREEILKQYRAKFK